MKSIKTTCDIIHIHVDNVYFSIELVPRVAHVILQNKRRSHCLPATLKSTIRASLVPPRSTAVSPCPSPDHQPPVQYLSDAIEMCVPISLRFICHFTLVTQFQQKLNTRATLCTTNCLSGGRGVWWSFAHLWGRDRNIL